jgi:hypothetical protein
MMNSSVSQKFAVESTADPLTGFHLTSVFDEKPNKAKDIKAMVDLAKSQFTQRSKAFTEYIRTSSVQVNLYYGDAITFCHELAARHSAAKNSAAVARAYTAQWSSKPLLLNGDGGKDLPSYFDVIDSRICRITMVHLILFHHWLRYWLGSLLLFSTPRHFGSPQKSQSFIYKNSYSWKLVLQVFYLVSPHWVRC